MGLKSVQVHSLDFSFTFLKLWKERAWINLDSSFPPKIFLSPEKMQQFTFFIEYQAPHNKFLVKKETIFEHTTRPHPRRQ